MNDVRTGSDLQDPELFRRNAFWDVLRCLREDQPVYWHPSDMAASGGFWVLSRYADIAAAYADSRTFSSRFGMNLGSDAAAVAAVSQQMLIVSDPPEHTRLKRALNAAFDRRAIARLDELIGRVVDDIVAEALQRQSLDFVDIARKLPNYVVCAFLGLSRPDWEWVGETTTRAFEGDSLQDRRSAHAEIFLYFEELVSSRRQSPSDDLISTIIGLGSDTEADLSDAQIILNLNGILSGANETTRYSSAGAVLALAERPEQYRLLRHDPESMVETTIEEVLRWTVPGLHALRTLTEDRELHGQHLAAGAQVSLWNCSANRDEAVFERPDEFDIGRRANRHLTFGGGRHLCLGARLARLELNRLLTSIAHRIDRIELIGPPVYNGSNFTWGLTSLPVRLHPAPAAHPGGPLDLEGRDG